jgi:hypothetical protein
MRLESAPPSASAGGGPLVVKFADLFDNLGTVDLRYSATLAALNGRDVLIEGYLSPPHVPGGDLSLVDQPGLCPDCSPVPAAAICLPGARAPLTADAGPGLMLVRGRLEFGLRIVNGTASVLRIMASTVRLVPRFRSS